MNMFKKNGGFTLVELIVVIAILAILAGVAIPAYTGYINKAEDTADTTSLAAIKTACQGALATEGNVKEITVTTNSDGAVTGVSAKFGDANTSVTLLPAATADDEATAHDEKQIGADFAMFMSNQMPTLHGSAKTGATWSEAGGWNP